MSTQEDEIPPPPRRRSLAEAYGNPELGTPERAAVDSMLQRDLRQEPPQEASRRSGGVDFSDVLRERRGGGATRRGDPLDFRDALEARRGRTAPREATPSEAAQEPEAAEEGLFQRMLNWFQREGEPASMGAEPTEDEPLLAGQMREPTGRELTMAAASRDPNLDPDVRQQAAENLERARMPERRQDPFAAGPGELSVQPAALPDQRDELLTAVDDELRAQGHDVPPRESSVTETPSGVLTTETISPSGIPRERVMATPYADEDLRRRRARSEDNKFLRTINPFDRSLDVNLEIGRQLAETGMSMALGTIQLLTSPRGEAPTLGTRPEDPAAAEGMREDFVPAEEQPPQGEGPLSGTLESLQATREDLRDYYGDPESTGATLTGAGARLGGELTMFMAPEAGLTRIAQLPRNVAMGARIAREVATGGPIDAMIAASDRDNSMAGFAADLARGQAEKGATMTGPTGEEITYDALARELDEIANTPWKRAIFDSTLGSFMAAGAMPLLDAAARALGRVRGASRSAGEQILREARIQSVTNNYRQALGGPLETRPIEGVDRLEGLGDNYLLGLRRELMDELARARQRGVMALAVERDLQRVQRALLRGGEEAAQAAPRAEPPGPPSSRLEELEGGGPRASRLEELRAREGAPSAATRMDELQEGGFDERARARGREAGLRTELDAVRRESETDPLTELPNKRGEARALERRPQPEGTVRLSFMGDLDHFKAVNDQLSQQAGDEYLQELSGILRDVAREEDVVTIARVGGDEFRVTMDVRAGTDPQALYDRFNRRVNEELARRGMDQVGDTELGMTFFEPGKKTAAKRRRLGQARRTRAQIDADRNPPPARLEPDQARRQAFEGATEGDIDVVRRATRAEVEAGRRGMQPAVEVPIGPRGEMPSADVFALKRGNIHTAPQALQYKLEGAQAAGRALQGVESWDYTKGGVMSVWWWDDPAADGFANLEPGWYVVNGHNRMSLARRTLGDDEPVNVLEIHAENPAEARAVGAQQNIAEGRGTPVDAAKYFRDAGLDADDVAELDIPMSESNVRKGLALARLHPAIFQDVVQKRVKVNRAVILGESGLEPEAQLALHRSDDINELNQGELEELVRIARGAGTREVTQTTLLGKETFRESNLLERVKISRRVKRELVRDRRIFGPLSKQSRAERIEAKGVGQVEAEKAGDIATEAERFEEVYNALSTRSGPIADILNRHARAVGAGEATLKEAADAATEEIKTTLRGIIEEGGLAREIDRGREGVRGADGGAEAPRAERDAEELPGGSDPGAGAGLTPPEEAARLLDVHVRRIQGNPNDDLILDTSYGEVARALRNLEAQDALTDEHLELARRVGDEDFIEGARAEGRELAGEAPGEARYTVEEHDGPRSEGRYHVIDQETGEVAARANYVDEAHRQADELNQGTGRPPEAQGPEGTDDMSLFERPGEYPARERAFEASRAQTAYSSPEAADELAEDVAQTSLDFADGSVDGFPTPAARLADIREDRQARAWVDIRGQRINGPEDVHRLLYPFRRPESEALHLIFLDENGRVLAHNLQTSGAVDYVKVSNGFAHRAYLRAKRLGADEVIISHNHPSGIPGPSKEDKMFLRNFRDAMGKLEAQERVRGMGYDPSDPGWDGAWKREFSDMMVGIVEGPSVTAWRAFVTDHDIVGEMRTAATGMPSALRHVTDHLHAVEPPRDWDWTQRTIHGNEPSIYAARLNAASFPERRVDIAYLDIKNNVLAVEPHSLEKVTSPDPSKWLDQQARAYGAWGAVFVTRGDKPTYHHVVFAVHRLRENKNVQTRVRDVIGLIPDEADHPRGWISAHNGLPAHRTEGDDREAWALFERELGLPDGEEIGLAAIRDPSSNRIWKGSSHFDALEQVPRDIPRERLEDGFVTTNGRFVGRQEAQQLEAGGRAAQEEAEEGLRGLRSELRSEEVRRSPGQQARERAEKAVEEFGTTEDPLEAGYILRDGTMLDFSGKRLGGSAGVRYMDHRRVAGLYEDLDRPHSGSDVEAVFRFEGEGNIRLSVFDDLLRAEFATTLDQKQLNSLERAAETVLRARSPETSIQNHLIMRVRDPKTGEVMATVEEELTSARQVWSGARRALREAEEAGYDPFNIRELSRGDAEIPPGLSDSDVLAPTTYPSVPRSIATDQANHIRDVAERLKDADPEAIQEAAEQMAPNLKPGARLIPIPGHDGSTAANRALASELARRVNGEVVDVLHRVPNEESSFARRRQGEPGLTADEIRHELVKPAGDLENAYLVDNVVATGATATSARRALGEELPVTAYSKEASVEHRRRLELEARQGGGSVREGPERYSTGAPYEPLTRPDGRGLGRMPAEEFGPVWRPGAEPLGGEALDRSRTRLLHGTSRRFERFSPEAVSNHLRRDGGGFFFTSDPSVARTFAEEGAGPEWVSATSVDRAASRGSPMGDVGGLIEDPFNLTVEDIQRVAADRLERGLNVYRYDEDGQLRQVTDPAQLGPEDVEGGIVSYRRGEAPRILQVEVPGYVLDLRVADGWPDELVEALSSSNQRDDVFLLRTYQRALEERPGRGGRLTSFNRAIANSPTFNEFARQRGIGKVLVVDEFESGFESVYVPTLERASIEGTSEIGRGARGLREGAERYAPGGGFAPIQRPTVPHPGQRPSLKDVYARVETSDGPAFRDALREHQATVQEWKDNMVRHIESQLPGELNALQRPILLEGAGYHGQKRYVVVTPGVNPYDMAPVRISKFSVPDAEDLEVMATGHDTFYNVEVAVRDLIDQNDITGRVVPDDERPRLLEEEGPYGQEDLFGATSPAGGGDQFRLFGERGGPLEGLSASEQRAANAIEELQDAVDQGKATPEQMERYNDAVKLLRRDYPIDTEEIIRRARQNAHEDRARADLDEDQKDIFGPQAGAALPRALVNIAAMGGGGTVGALLDDENPWRGAAIGAILAGGLAELPRAWTDVMAGRKQTLQERVQRAAENAARGEPPGAPEYRGSGRVMTEADLEEAVNFEKFDVDPTGQQRLEDETRRVAQLSGVKNPHKVVSLEEAQALARELALDPSDVLPQVAERMTGAELTALGNIVTDNVRKSVQILEALNHPALTLEQERVLRRNLSTREAQNNFLLERILRGRSQKGRDLSHLRLTAMGARDASGKLEPEPFYIQAKRFLGEDAFTTEHAARINKFIADDDLEGLADYISGLRTSSFTEKLVTWWKAGLMSAPITQIRNLAGNTSMAVLETVKDVPAYMGDRLISLAFDTGLQAKAAPRPGRLAQASWEGVKKGAHEAEQVLRTGVRIDDAAIKYDLTRKEVSFNNVFADVFTKTVFRSMIAGDRFFKGIAFMRALDEMAQVTALNEGLERGSEAFKQRTADLIKAPTDEMAAQAIHDAEIATFTNRNILGDVGVHVKRQIPMMEGVIPFTNTPANIALRTVDYTPFGFLRTARGALELSRAVAEGIDDAVKRNQVLQLQRQVANDFGRNVTGTLALAAVGYKLAEAGVMTGSWPTDRRTQREWMRRGIPSNGVYIPEGTPGMPEDMQGTWSTIENISPWGNIMAFGANVYDVAANPETSSVTDMVAGAGVSIATTVSEQSFLTGLSEALSALNNPERASGDAFRRTVASFLVPNIVKKISEGLDPNFREFETLGEDVGRRLPPAARFGPLETQPRLDVFGRAQERDGGILKSLFDPFLMRTDKALEDEVLMELSRTGASVSELQRRDDETREEFRQRKIETGQRLYQGIQTLTTSGPYQAIPEVVASAIEQNADLRGRLDPEEYARDMQRGLIEDLVSSIKRGATRRAQVQGALEELEGLEGNLQEEGAGVP